MKTNTKKKGVLISWDEARGYGFISIGRDAAGARITRFLHYRNIERTEDPIPGPGAEVWFHEALDPKGRGPLAVEAEILSRAARITRSAGLKVLAGGSK